MKLFLSLNPEPINLDWLVETTETWCKDRAIHNAILGGIQILDGKDKDHTPEYLARDVIRGIICFV